MKNIQFHPEKIPAELKLRKQWVGFKVEDAKKTPCIADNPRKMASSTDRSTWRSYEDALAGLRAGSFNAIAYALDGDYIGIDLDDCLTDEGDLLPYANDILDQSNSYAEVSQSGAGLHILLSGALPDGKGKKGFGVEVYSHKRFFIVTGNHWESTPEEIRSNPGVIKRILKRNVTQQLQQSEQTNAIALPPPELLTIVSDCYVTYSPDKVIMMTLPKGRGQRNRRLFDLARGLRFNSGLHAVALAGVKPWVRKWHEKALPNINTKSFDDTWAEFGYAWDRVRLPLGASPVMACWKIAKVTPPPAVASEYESVSVRSLIGLCAAMASLSQDRHFYLSTHVAARLLLVTPMQVWRWLNMLVFDEVLQEKAKGCMNIATRYRWIRADSG